MKGLNDPVLALGGSDPTGQLMRWLPAGENRGAAEMWRGACFKPSIDGFDEQQFKDNMGRDLKKQSVVETITTGKNKDITKTVTQTFFSATVSKMPEFSIAAWKPKPLVNKDDGLWENTCWPRNIAPQDPGFVLLGVDLFYGEGANHKAPPYKYAEPYDPPNNGA
jgi:hypothetical protein